MNLDLFDKLNDRGKGNNNFIRNFIEELNKALERNNKTYCVASNVNPKGEIFIVAQDGTGAGRHFKIEELPKEIQYGSILRYKNGQFVIDRELTKVSLEEDRKANEEVRSLVSQYKMEGTEYIVEQKLDEYVVLKNQDTGFKFSTSDFEEGDFEKLYEGTTLQCKDSNYIIKEN